MCQACSMYSRTGVEGEGWTHLGHESTSGVLFQTLWGSEVFLTSWANWASQEALRPTELQVKLIITFHYNLN
jgi:hypothetical protein